MKKKPDIFLGITMGMLVLAAVLCVAILLAQKAGKKPADNNAAVSSQTTAPVKEDETTKPTDKPDEGEKPGPATADPIDAAGLRAKMNSSLSDLRSQWQAVVVDPANKTNVAAYWKAKDANELMKSVKLVRLFIMADAFQQVKDGTLKEEDILADVTAMITKDDNAASDRVTQQLGGGDLAKGKENVKAYAQKTVGQKIGYNRSFEGGTSGWNYISAQTGADLLSKICRGECVSPELDQKMVDILLASEGAPEIDPGLKDAECGLVCDVQKDFCVCAMGVVRKSGRLYVVSIISNEINNMESGKKKITELISMTESYFGGEPSEG